MSRNASPLVEEIAKRVRDSVRFAVAALQGPKREHRTVFHGPPISYLRPVFEILSQGGGISATFPSGEDVIYPVLLQVDHLPSTSRNPAVGDSGLCDEHHLLALRNSPDCPRFVVLVPPGRHSSLSVASASNEFGLAAESNSGSATIDIWWNDRFIQSLVEETLRVSGVSDDARQGGRKLVECAVRAADEIDHNDVARQRAWDVLARVASINPSERPYGRQLSLACGLPPVDDGSIQADEQLDCLSKIARTLVEDGFRQGIGRVKDGVDDEVDKRALDSLLEHLQRVCELQSAFERVPQFFYAPSQSDQLTPPPDWWTQLTIERWMDILEEDKQPTDALRLRCTNSLVPRMVGLDALVTSEASISVSRSEGEEEPLDAVIIRQAGGASGRREWNLRLPDAIEVTDDEIPTHRAPVRFSIEAVGYRTASIKVVALATWQVGVVPLCRTARKIWLPKKAKANRDGLDYECSMDLIGRGRHYIDLYVRHDVEVDATATGGDDVGLEENASQPAVSRVSDNAFGFEVEATAECYYDVQFSNGPDKQALRIHLSCEDSVADGCRTEFERLIRMNRAGERRAAPEVQIDRHVRCADLQSWILDKMNAPSSFLPLVLAPDYAKRWRPPNWTMIRETIYSEGQFLHDPRPLAADMTPPQQFIDARVALFAKIRGSEGSDLVEAAQLGSWISTSIEFAELVEAYVSSYLAWLDSDPEVAAWSDLLLIVSQEADGRTLQQEPDAVIVSPLHPLRLGWHCIAQKTLHAAARSSPCPAASILDPNRVPDVLALPLRTALGKVRYQPFFAVESGSDYWGVLWNGSRLDRLAARVENGPFDQEFGIQVGGVSSGFSLSQVQRALDDVSAMLVAKPTLNILVANASGQNTACNEGLLAWCRDRSREDDGLNVTSSGMGRRLVHIFDDRKPAARPEDASISNVAEDSSNAVRWFGSVREGLRPDLGIIAQLETSSPSAEVIDMGSPVGTGALIRHRVRRQLSAGSGAFLTETRSGVARPESGDVLADKVMKGIVRLECLGGDHYGYTFAPSVHAIQHVLKARHASFAAVSSTAVDPACFLGGWLDDAYLWDFDLPSYSQRAGDTNGYYLLSQIKEVDRETLRSILGRLPRCSSLPDSIIDEAVYEVARRGIPTVRGLAAGDSGASGDLGLFLASRLIQDEFRRSRSGPRSLLRVVEAEGTGHTLSLVIPVDPFAGYLDDLRSATQGQPALRPDLIVASIHVMSREISCRLTPIEVKYRGGIVMQQSQCEEALQQAKALSQLFVQIRERAQKPDHLIWQLALQHVLVSMLGFAFRVYSQLRVAADESRDCSAFHGQVISAVLSEEINLQIDGRGRLIVFDASGSSGPRDVDGDGFFETIVVGNVDAAEIVLDNSDNLYTAIRSRVGSWELQPQEGGSSRFPKGASAKSGKSSGPTDEVQTPDPRYEIGSGPVVISIADAGKPSIPPPMPEASGENTVGADSALLSGTTATDDVVVRGKSGVDVLIGTTVGSFRESTCRINLSDTNLNQLNIGVVGDLGTGKTQLLKSLVYQISRASDQNGGVRPRFLIFDYKKDYSDSQFVNAVGARVVTPHRLPINLFDVTGIDSVAPWLDRFKFFTDVLDKIFSGIGPVQRQQLKNAVRQAYEDCSVSGRQPTIYDVHEKYRALLGNKSDAPLSIIDDLVDMEMFSRDPASASTSEHFLDGVVVISLASLGQDDRTKNMLVAIMLNVFYEHMLRIPKRPFTGTTPQLRTIDSFLLVDEADNIMRYEFDVLRKILLQGREFGVGVVLASQYLRHFRAGTTDYREPLLTWLVHKVPNVTPQELGALGITSELTELAERIKGLPMHHCMLKTLGIPGSIVQGTPFYKLLLGGR